MPEGRLVAGIGLEGDAHAGATVQHRSRVMRDPRQPNLRQVHLIAEELLADLRARGFRVKAGSLGENFTTRGVNLLALPAGTLLRIGCGAAVRVTGLRNPCRQLDDFAPGLMAALLEHRPGGALQRLAGVMGVVEAGGTVRPGDRVTVELPPLPWRTLEPV